MKVKTNLLCMAAAFALAMPACAAGTTKPRSPKSATKLLTRQKEAGLATITENAARAHVYFLADDLLEGRRAGQRGSRIAKQYIISRLREAGVKPLFGESYEQPFQAYADQKLKRGVRFFVDADSIAQIKKHVHQRMDLSNVLGVIPGRRSDEIVVVGAHLDHEGMYADVAGDNIYNGADDNASGVTAVLQIMKAFAESGATPERAIVFAFWDGEEFGLLGSKYFVSHYADISKVKGYLNFDMVGGNNKPEDPTYMVYFYTDTHPVFGDWLKDDINRYSLQLNPSYRPWDNPIGGSDQSSFHLKGVPIIWYHTDAQPHYNQPSDEPNTINYPKLTDISRASFLTTWHLANDAAY